MKSHILFLVLIFSFSAFGQNQAKNVYFNPDKMKCAVCDSVSIEGQQFSIFDTPEIYLAVAGIDRKKYLEIAVYFENKTGNKQFDIKIGNAALLVFDKMNGTKETEYRAITPEEAAKKAKGSQAGKNILMLFLAEKQAKENAAMPETALTAVDTQNNTVASAYEAVLADALKGETVLPKKSIAGSIYFERIKDAYMYVAFMVGNTTYLRTFRTID